MSFHKNLLKIVVVIRICVNEKWLVGTKKAVIFTENQTTYDVKSVFSEEKNRI